RAKSDDHTLGFSGAQRAHEPSMILTPLLAGLVSVVAQMARVSRGFIGAVPTVKPPLRRVTPLADDEVGVTPPASTLPASRMILHRRAPSWCDRREELERDHAR